MGQFGVPRASRISQNPVPIIAGEYSTNFLKFPALSLTTRGFHIGFTEFPYLGSMVNGKFYNLIFGSFLLRTSENRVVFGCFE